MQNLIRGIVSNSLAILILYGLSSLLNLQKYAALALGIQYFVFIIHGLPYNSEKFYDASGSLTHLSLIILSLLEHNIRNQRQLVNSILVCIWLTRLGSFLFARILKDSKDDRFVEVKKNKLRFLGAWSIQAVWVFLIDLPVVIINDQKSDVFEISWVDIVAWAGWFIGFLFETIADAQKSAFKAQKENEGKFIQEGLWAYCRHPNYFGEIMMWICISISCSQQFIYYQFLGWLSPAFTIFLLLKVSGVPMLESLGQKKWGSQQDYQDYMKITPCIIPSFLLGKNQIKLIRKCYNSLNLIQLYN